MPVGRLSQWKGSKRLGKTTESDEHLFATDTGVYTMRTVNRVPETEQRRAYLVKSLQGAPWDRLAGRPAGRPRKTAPPAPSVATPPVAKASERPSEDASERRKISLFRWSLMSFHFFVRQTRRTNRAQHLDPWIQRRSRAGQIVDSGFELYQGGNRNVQSASQPEQSDSNVISGVKRDARAAELPDEDEQGCKCQQVEGLTTGDAEEIPCEFSVEDDFEIDEIAEGVDEEIVKAVLAGKKKELDAMEAFGIFDVCEELPKDAKIITTRRENVPKGDKWRCWFVAREFRHDDPEMEGPHTTGSTAATGRLVDMRAGQHGYSILCLDAENA